VSSYDDTLAKRLGVDVTTKVLNDCCRRSLQKIVRTSLVYDRQCGIRTHIGL
jgi:hypothetical protein